MKTEFKVFDSDWGYSSIEDSIKEYQQKHHLEVKNIISIRDKPCDIVVGVIFEEDIVSSFNSKYRDSAKGALNGFMSPPEPGS